MAYQRMEMDGEKLKLVADSKIKSGWFACIKARHALALMIFLGNFNMYCLRVGLSVAIVAMVNSTSSPNTSVISECLDDRTGDEVTSSTENGEFDWDEKTQGQILAAFYYGYIVTQIPGGWLAERVGGKRLVGLGVGISTFCTLVTSVAARAGVRWLMAVRILAGLGEGVTFPAVNTMWALWAPVSERASLVTFSFTGVDVGTVFAMCVSGFLAKHGFAGGWPSVFYVFGTMGCVWLLAWVLLVHETPARHPTITEDERRYIENSLGVKEKTETPPWRHIVTSGALWAIVIAHFANNWGYYSTVTLLPTYMKHILGYNIQQNGVLSSLPFVALSLVQMTAGFVSDFLLRRRILSTCHVRKLMVFVGCLSPAATMAAVGHTSCNHDVLATVLLVLALGSSGPIAAAILVNHLDIAPRFAGTLFGITNGVASIPGFLGPIVCGALTNHNQTAGRWRIFFNTTGGVYMTGALLFVILGQGEEQWWAKPARR